MSALYICPTQTQELMLLLLCLGRMMHRHNLNTSSSHNRCVSISSLGLRAYVEDVGNGATSRPDSGDLLNSKSMAPFYGVDTTRLAHVAQGK